jgi:hypothetical protein
LAICFATSFLTSFLTFFLLRALVLASGPAIAVPASAATSDNTATMITGDRLVAVIPSIREADRDLGTARSLREVTLGF